MSSDIIPRRAEDHDVVDTRPPHYSASSNLMPDNSGSPNKNNNSGSNKHKNSNDDDLCLSGTHTNANSSKRPDMKSMTEEFHERRGTKQNSPRTDESSLKTDNRDENNNNHSSTNFAASQATSIRGGRDGTNTKGRSHRRQMQSRVGIKRIGNPSSERTSLSITARHNSNDNYNNSNLNNNVPDDCSSHATNKNRSSTNKNICYGDDHPLFAAVAEQNNPNVNEFSDQIGNMKRNDTSATESGSTDANNNDDDDDANDIIAPPEANSHKIDNNGFAISSPFPFGATNQNNNCSTHSNTRKNTTNNNNQSLLLCSSASQTYYSTGPIYRRVGLLPRSATMIHGLSQKLRAVMLAPAGMMVSENAEIMKRLSEAGVVIPLVEDQITEQEQYRRRLRREKYKKMLHDQQQEEEEEQQRKNATTLSPQQQEQIRAPSLSPQSQQQNQEEQAPILSASARKQMMLFSPSGLLQQHANSSLIRNTTSNVDVVSAEGDCQNNNNNNNNNNETEHSTSSASHLKPTITTPQRAQTPTPSPSPAFVTVSARFPYAGGVSVMLTSRVGRVLPRTIVLQETVCCDIASSFLRQDDDDHDNGQKETVTENQSNNNSSIKDNNILHLVGPSPSVFDHVQRVHNADGSYRKLAKLGAGSYGEVWLVAWAPLVSTANGFPSPLFPKSESPDRFDNNNNQSKSTPKKQQSSPSKRRKFHEPLATAAAMKMKKKQAQVVRIDDVDKNNKDSSNQLTVPVVPTLPSSSRKTPSTLANPIKNPSPLRHNKSPDATRCLQALMQSVPQLQNDGDDASLIERNAMLDSNPKTNADTNSNMLAGLVDRTNSTVIPASTNIALFMSKNETHDAFKRRVAVPRINSNVDNSDNNNNHHQMSIVATNVVADDDGHHKDEEVVVVVARRNLKELPETDNNDENTLQENEKQEHRQHNAKSSNRASPNWIQRLRLNNVHNNNNHQSPTFSRKLFASLFYSATSASNVLQQKSPSPFIRRRSSPIILQSKKNDNYKQGNNNQDSLKKRKISPFSWAASAEIDRDNKKGTNSKFGEDSNTGNRATSGTYPVVIESRSSITFATEHQSQQQQQQQHQQRRFDASIIAEETKNNNNNNDDDHTVIADEKFSLLQLQRQKEQNYLVAQLGLSLDSTAAAFNSNHHGHEVGMNSNNLIDKNSNSNGYVKRRSAEGKFSVTSDQSGTNMQSSPLLPAGATATTLKTKTDDDINNNTSNKRDSSSVQTASNNFYLGGLESHCGHVSSLACTRPLISLAGKEMFKREVIAVCKIEIIASKNKNNNNNNNNGDPANTVSPPRAKVQHAKLAYFDDGVDDNDQAQLFNTTTTSTTTNNNNKNVNDHPKILRRFGDKSNDEDDDYIHQQRDVYSRPGTRLSSGVGELSAARMDNEADILSNLAYPGIIGFVDKFTLEGKRHLVLEFVDGGDLDSELKRRRQLIQEHRQQQQQQEHLSSGSRFGNNRSQNAIAASASCSPLARPFNEDSILFLFAQILMALEYLHRNNILHRDLKSANVLLSKKWQVKLTDFGLARRFNEDIDNAVMRKLCGTPTHLSPCVILNRQASEKADIWAAGCILYELITVGMQPFPGDTVDDVVRAILNCEPVPIAVHRTGVSQHLMNLVASCLSKTPTQRPSAKQLLQLPVLQRAMAEYVRRFKTAAMAVTGTPLDAVWAKVVEEHQAMILRDGKAKVGSQKAKKSDDRARSRETRTRQFTDVLKESFRAAETTQNNNYNNQIQNVTTHSEGVTPQSRSSLSMNRKNNNNLRSCKSGIAVESGDCEEYVISCMRRKHSLEQNELYTAPAVRRALSLNNHTSNNHNNDDDVNNNGNPPNHNNDNSAERSGGAFVAVSSSLALLEAALTSVNGGVNKTSHGCGGGSFPAIERGREP